MHHSYENCVHNILLSGRRSRLIVRLTARPIDHVHCLQNTPVFLTSS
ncbi:hypothetical protein SOVF_036120 [Spinacia oleracea]|nr:hypothetical protein SOVF_036120 [Spinacia oleracea]